MSVSCVGWVGHYFGWVGVYQALFWVGGGGWTLFWESGGGCTV